VRVETQEDFPTSPASQELDDQVLIYKHAALDFVDPKCGRLPEGQVGMR